MSRLGVSVLDDLVDWVPLGCLWEDRNVLAHRGGVIDDRHSKKTGSVTGDVIDLEAADVQSAIDEIGAARFALVAGVWDKLAPGMGAHAARAAGLFIGERLRAGRWRQAEGLARVQQAFAADAEATAIAKVHRWLARDIGLGPAAILTELQAWDVTGLPREYQLARHILMRQDEAAITLLRELVADGTITSADLRDWPLFDRLRAEGKLTDPTS